MICYRDMTFCRGDGCVKFDDCPRAMTQEVIDSAKAIDIGIAQWVNPKELECYE
jgi:hypothetical protein